MSGDAREGDNMAGQPTQQAGIAARLNPTTESIDRAYAWGMASTVPDLTVSGFAPTLDDALFQAFASAVAEHPLDLLMVYCQDESFSNRLAEFNPYQHVWVAEWTQQTHCGQLTVAGRKAASDLLALEYGPEVLLGVPDVDDNADMTPLMIATDGSRSKLSSSWAWVTNSGRYGSGSGPARNPLCAEVLAISEALKSAPKLRPVVLISDSKWAVSHARKVRQDPECSALLECHGLPAAVLCATQARIRAHMNVTYRWVRGHAGDPLNEAADRLAVHTRRCHEADLPVTDDVVTKIITDMLTATAPRLEVRS
jgi:ribonuclease HI